MSLLESLQNQSQIIIRQRRELIELLGFESRNKYEICDENGNVIGFCAEQQKGLLGILLRQFLGHWRRFDLHFFNNDRREVLIVKHPFRFFFQRLEIHTADGKYLGALQQRFAFIRKKFDLENSLGQVIMSVNSGFFQFWTFPFKKGSVEVAVIRKKWSGGLKEIFTDADNFQISFNYRELNELERTLILASGVFIDLQYFEAKGRGGYGEALFD
ncbi:phospholipid scramblase-related protein [Bdellovibrio sp. HCB337]|uniref:phospholipid scramblase-related protein n=1 Tax=Bdellovibrio sp. HCB337 TaxID=3394358 RepID=UPI0039A61BF4